MGTEKDRLHRPFQQNILKHGTGGAGFAPIRAAS